MLDLLQFSIDVERSIYFGWSVRAMYFDDSHYIRNIHLGLMQSINSKKANTSIILAGLHTFDSWTTLKENKQIMQRYAKR
jgi:hypothetical protein